MRNKICLLALLICLDGWCQSEKKSAFQGFSGGMILHTGYMFGKSGAPKYNDIQGATFGIGGAARVNLWKYLRIGGEGFISTMSSGFTNQSSNLAKGSYITYGWGGLLADACWRMEKIWPYVGMTVGGGTIKSLFIYDGDENDWQPERETIFNNQSYVLVDPFVGMDYCLTQKIHLTFRFDWIMAIHKKELIQPTGPRLYLGFMFCH